MMGKTHGQSEETEKWSRLHWFDRLNSSVNKEIGLRKNRSVVVLSNKQVNHLRLQSGSMLGPILIDVYMVRPQRR